MDDINRSVAHNVKNGQYFKDAREWYVQKYLCPITERTILVIMMSVLLFAAFVTITSIFSTLPIERQVPFIVKVSNSIDYYSVIKRIGINSEDPQRPLTEHLISNYVLGRESYDYSKLEAQKKRVKGSSSKQVYKRFIADLSINNPTSPILLYQQEIQRTVEILSVTLQSSDKSFDSALVKFKATLNNGRTGQKDTSIYSALIAFTISDINEISQTKTPMQFIVTEYNVQKE